MRGIAGGGPLDSLRDVVTAGLRYYGRIGRLAVEFIGALSPVVYQLTQYRARPVEGSGPAPDTHRREAGDGSTILIEAEEGRQGIGVFHVENRGSARVSSPVSVSAFTDPLGHVVRPTLSFEPAMLALEPGQQAVVEVRAVIDTSLTPDVRYAARISLPGLSKTGISLVLRRRPTPAPVSAPTPPRKAAARAHPRRKPRAQAHDRRGG